MQAAIAVTLASLFLPQLKEPPFVYLASFFLVQPLYMLVFFFIFVVLLRGVEEEVGETDYFIIYFVGVLLGNLGLLTLGTGNALPTTGALGGLFAVAGVFIAKHPYELFTYELLYPMPAILCLIAIVFINFFTPDMRFDYLPLLFGVAAGYAINKRNAGRGYGAYSSSQGYR